MENQCNCSTLAEFSALKICIICNPLFYKITVGKLIARSESKNFGSHAAVPGCPWETDEKWLPGVKYKNEFML